MSLLATVVREILQSAVSHGAAYDELCRLSGLTGDELNTSDNMVDWEKAVLIWVPLKEVSGDELIGLHLGMKMNISMLGMVGFLMQSSKDLEQAIQTFCHYSSIVTPMIDFIYTTEDVVCVEMQQNKMWQQKYPETARQALEFAVAALIKFLRTLSGKNIAPHRVELEFSKREVSAYRQALESEVVFNAATTKVLFRIEDMKRPVVSSDKSLFELFNSILSQKKAALASECYAEKLKELLFMHYKGQIPTIEEAALELGVSTRALQRKLQEERTSYRSIANEVKKDLAFQLMKNPAIQIQEVAHVMGYSDLSAFRRAFKSWTKQTPKAARQQIKNL